MQFLSAGRVVSRSEWSAKRERSGREIDHERRRENVYVHVFYLRSWYVSVVIPQARQ